MRDYIILNGVNSNTITGLLISKLPPITKPKQRTTVEEIDGRDGDIVTKLGYSAYDKEIEIGLYGDFDIDDVIAYFNSEGTVTFSNEPDKYYNYEILEQINFDKLIRFRTATVKMHVQPFKYPLEETPVEIAYQYVNNEAEEMDLDNTADAPMNIDLKGNTYQNGEPTPDTPIEIQVVSGDNTIIVSNSDNTQSASYPINLPVENLFNVNDIFDTNINASGVESASDLTKSSNYIDALPNTTYTSSLYFNYNSAALRYHLYDANKNWIKQATAYYTTDTPNRQKVSFTTTEDTKYIRFTLRQGDTEDKNEYDIQLEVGTKANSYTPYGTTPIELCKIGTYQDRIFKNTPNSTYYDSNLEDNVWYLNKQIGKVVLDGSEDWYTGSGTTQVMYRGALGYIHDTAKLPCNISKNCQMPNNNLYFYDTGLTLEQFKTLLNTTNAIVYGRLSTPTYTEITDTNLINQLNNLANVRSYDTSTHITQNANDKPFILNATALQKGSDTGVVNNIGNIYSKPTIDIEGTGTIGVYLEENQIFSVDLSNSNEIIIDTTNLEAYDPTTNALMNRQVTGDYSNFKLNVGNNNVKVTGNVTKATISNYVRWL